MGIFAEPSKSRLTAHLRDAAFNITGEVTMARPTHVMEITPELLIDLAMSMYDAANTIDGLLGVIEKFKGGRWWVASVEAEVARVMK